MIIDFTDTLPEIKEGKEWLALISYPGSVKDANRNGIRDLNPIY